jgi:hypothetical protein
VAGADYRHGRDPVPEVPSWLLHPRGLFEIGESRPRYFLDFLSIADHLMGGYRAALAA